MDFKGKNSELMKLSIIPRIDQYRSKLIDDSSQWQFSYPKIAPVYERLYGLYEGGF